MEKAVKYSERSGRGSVSYGSLKKALDEMKIRISFRKEEMEERQQPTSILAWDLSVGPLRKRESTKTSSPFERGTTRINTG